MRNLWFGCVVGCSVQYSVLHCHVRCRYSSAINAAFHNKVLALQGMSDLVAMDLVPEPTIVAAALRACRR
jgi:hypothetical protein